MECLQESRAGWATGLRIEWNVSIRLPPPATVVRMGRFRRCAFFLGKRGKRADWATLDTTRGSLGPRALITGVHGDALRMAGSDRAVWKSAATGRAPRPPGAACTSLLGFADQGIGSGIGLVSGWLCRERAGRCRVHFFQLSLSSSDFPDFDLPTRKIYKLDEERSGRGTRACIRNEWTA